MVDERVKEMVVDESVLQMAARLGRTTVEYIRKLFYKQIEITLDRTDFIRSSRNMRVGSCYVSQGIIHEIYQTVPTCHGKIVEMVEIVI